MDMLSAMLGDVQTLTQRIKLLETIKTKTK